MFLFSNVTPVHKKTIDQRKVIIDLSAYNQTYQKSLKDYFEGMSYYHCGYRKGHSAHALISLLEKWRNNVDQGHMFGALLTDLLKAFDCLPHDINIAKLNT